MLNESVSTVIERHGVACANHGQARNSPPARIQLFLAGSRDQELAATGD